MNTPLKRLLPLLTVCVLGGPVNAAVLDCDIGGQPVNTSNGASTAGKTGMMKCVDRDTRKLVREEEYRDGRPIGYRKFVDYSGVTHVGTYNEKGNRDGEMKQYDASGVLIADERYVNGDTAGLQTYYHKNGQVKRRAFNQPGRNSLASIEYNERGQITELRCAEKSLIAEDSRVCGFDGKASAVTLYSAKGEVAGEARYLNGKRLSITSLSASGLPARSEEVQGERVIVRQHFPEGALRLETVIVGKARESEREFAKTGQPVRETRWQDGRVADETLWYLNGHLKSTTRFDRTLNPALVRSDEFWDNGKIRARTVRDERHSRIGLQQSFDETGALQSESMYENRKLVRRKVYKDGALLEEEHYFEDGSRKSVRKGD